MTWLLPWMACTTPPQICNGGSRSERVVDRFWGTLDEHYAVFDLRLEAPWTDVGREACRAVVQNDTDAALFDALLGMAQALDDGHVQVASRDQEADGWVTPWPYYDQRTTVLDLIGRPSPLTRGANGSFRWTRLGNLGYLSIRWLDDLGGSGSEASDRRRAADALDVAFASFEGTDGLVIDLRFCEGGWDAVGLDLAARLQGNAVEGWSTAQRDGPAHDDFTAFWPTVVEAGGPSAYAQPVVVLTSGGTFSAGETLVLALRTRPRVTVVGEPTSGHLSDLYGGRLPNGWSFTYSGDRYRAPDGAFYEGEGIPPDEVVAFDPEALAEGRDVMLEAALRR